VHVPDGNGATGAPVHQTGAPLASPQLTRVPNAAITNASPSARLLGVKTASIYMGVSTWVTWRLVKDGTLKPVQIPRIKRVLLDREDLDALIARWKAL
jgi:hypothetical protein